MKFPDWLCVIGDPGFRGDCPTETAEQVTFFNQLAIQYPEIRRIAIHPRNEGKRTMAQAMRHKAEGMTEGAADIIIPGRRTLVIELKRQDHTKSRFEPGQLEYLETCQRHGAFVFVALGWRAAMDAVEDWLNATR